MELDLPSVTLCGRPSQDFLTAIENFHGWTAPGIVLGGFMVDWARELVGADTEADAVVETCHCLPDAVQLFTPCTLGNGWLKVLDWDKFALSLYDRHSLEGHRVWLDIEKTRLFPHVFDWYMRRVPKRELPPEVLLPAIFAAGRLVLSARAVRITHLYQRNKKDRIEICPGCGEAYPAAQGPQCLSCQGNGYYA